MDALDILLDEDEEPTKAPVTEDSGNEDDVLLALEEFQGSTAAPKDRLEALKILMNLLK